MGEFGYRRLSEAPDIVGRAQALVAAGETTAAARLLRGYLVTAEGDASGKDMLSAQGIARPASPALREAWDLLVQLEGRDA